MINWIKQLFKKKTFEIKHEENPDIVPEGFKINPEYENALDNEIQAEEWQSQSWKWLNIEEKDKPGYYTSSLRKGPTTKGVIKKP